MNDPVGLIYEQWRTTIMSEEKTKGLKIPPVVFIVAAFVILVGIGIATS